jgi:hypothetical protein
VLAVDGKNCLVGGCGVDAAQSEWHATGVSKESPGSINRGRRPSARTGEVWCVGWLRRGGSTPSGWGAPL